VRIIAHTTLNNFVKYCVGDKDRKAVKRHLDAWFAEIRQARWANPAELKAQHRSASIVSEDRVVFNIQGNHYRLIVAISYLGQIVLIKWLGTHREYDHIDAATVEYDKERYDRSSHSH
jgi:mRNA interferase HigB